jgi:hypothetical protein
MSTKMTNYENTYYEANFVNDDDPLSQAEYIMEKYIYCGYHAEKYDSIGPEKILHFISKETLGERDLKTLGEWEYELEVWPSDKYYGYLLRWI